MRFMRIILLLLSVLVISFTFQEMQSGEDISTIITPEFELIIPAKHKGLLILFPCFPCDAQNTKTEAKFIEDVTQNGIGVMLFNFNQKLFLSDSENHQLTNIISKAVKEHELKTDNIYIGGFSSGGNVSILLSNHLIKTKNNIQPKGIFAVDSPVDLERLYRTAENDVKLNVSEDAVNESTFLLQFFETNLGKPEKSMNNYEKYSPYIYSTNSVENISSLKNIKVRFYTEPDLDWQKQNKNRKFEDLNAFQLEKTYEALKKLGNNNAEYIATENKGFRANGVRHPHSWAIVDGQDLVNWMIEK